MEIEARIAEYLEPARREFERQRILIEHMETAEVDVRSPDRTVTLTQTCAGEIVDIQIASGAFDRHDERSFALVLKTLLTDGREAGHQLAEQLTEQTLYEQEVARRGR